MREEKFHIYLNDDEYSRLIMGHFFGTYFDIFKHLSCVILTNPTTSSITINDLFCRIVYRQVAYFTKNNMRGIVCSLIL